MSVLYSQNNPKRPVGWRWSRATEIAAGSVPSRRRDDEWVRRGAAFKRRLDRAATDDARFRLSEEDPTMFFAADLYEADDDPMRYEIEARLLARDDNANIAANCATSPEVIEAYERLFFNVRERLDSKGYIIHCVLGPAFHRGLSERDYDMLWKWYGYTFGPIMLESFIHQAINPDRPQSAAEVQGAFRRAGYSSLLRKQAIAAMTVPVNQFTQLELLATYAKFVEIEKMSGSKADAMESFKENIAATLAMLPWGVGKYATQADPQNVDKYRAMGTEPRSHELMLLSVGQEPADDPMLQTMHFPEEVVNGATVEGSGS